MSEARRMLSVEHCRRVLGKAAAGMSDAEIAEAREQLRVLARVAIRMYLDRKQQAGEKTKEKGWNVGIVTDLSK